MPPGLKKILIVDDTPEGLVLLRGLVERPLVTVFEANSGRAALQAHRREHADLILLDLQMPGLSGDEVARTIRADSALRDVSILMFADDARAASRERCMAAGANDFLSKPFKPAELAAHISQLLDVAVRKNTQLLAQVEVRDGGPSLAPFIGRILNLSSTGLLLEADVPLEVGRELELTFFIPGTRTQARAVARVVRIAKSRGAARWGLRFTTLAQSGRRALMEYVRRGGPGRSD